MNRLPAGEPPIREAEFYVEDEHQDNPTPGPTNPARGGGTSWWRRVRSHLHWYAGGSLLAVIILVVAVKSFWPDDVPGRLALFALLLLGVGVAAWYFPRARGPLTWLALIVGILAIGSWLGSDKPSTEVAEAAKEPVTVNVVIVPRYDTLTITHEWSEWITIEPKEDLVWEDMEPHVSYEADDPQTPPVAFPKDQRTYQQTPDGDRVRFRLMASEPAATGALKLKFTPVVTTR